MSWKERVGVPRAWRRWDRGAGLFSGEDGYLSGEDGKGGGKGAREGIPSGMKLF